MVDEIGILMLGFQQLVVVSTTDVNQTMIEKEGEKHFVFVCLEDVECVWYKCNFL